MKGTSTVTPGRLAALRDLDRRAKDLNGKVLALHERLNSLYDERERATDEVATIEKNIDVIGRDQRHAYPAERQRLSEDLAKLQARRKQKLAHIEDLKTDIEAYTSDREIMQQARNSYGSVVEAAIRAFGHAGQEVRRMLRASPARSPSFSSRELAGLPRTGIETPAPPPTSTQGASMRGRAK